LRLFSFGGYGLALALALVVFGAYDSYPKIAGRKSSNIHKSPLYLISSIFIFISRIF